MSCRYRIGDALCNLGVYVVVLTYFLLNGIREDALFFIPVGFLATTFIGGALLNRRDRLLEEEAKIRRNKQLALGVPPDEVIG